MAPKWKGGSPGEWLWAPEEMRWRRVYSGRLDQVQAACVFAGRLFAGERCADVVEKAVSELGGNAIRHTRSGEEGGWFGLEVVYADPVYVAVTDLGGYGRPCVRPANSAAQTQGPGRGLQILAELAVTLGIHGSPDLGHTVWVDLDLHGEPEAGPQTGHRPKPVLVG
ncbi:ATP-binding protein [Spirillospora sp. NPDC127200]